MDVVDDERRIRVDHHGACEIFATSSFGGATKIGSCHGMMLGTAGIGKLNVTQSVELADVTPSLIV